MAAGRPRKQEEPVEVEDLVIVSDQRGKLAIAVTDGKTFETYKGKKQLKWIWLPRSQVEVSEASADGTVNILMPEWLALKVGLI
jgi:hypothetical protein